MNKKELNITSRFKKGYAFVKKSSHPFVFMEASKWTFKSY